MRAHFLQHVPFEGLGSIEPWLRNAGYEVTATRLFAEDPFPQIEAIDFLIVMGGPMSVTDEADYPWLINEKAFVKQAIESGTPVLGICLGAQLIADAMGGTVYPNAEKEIGWFPVTAEAMQTDAFTFPETVDAFHWHGETFSLPKGAVRLARSDACENQAFQLGQRVIGLQFHLETTPDSARALVENCGDELVAGEYVQYEKDILSATRQRYKSANGLMAEILEHLTCR